MPEIVKRNHAMVKEMYRSLLKEHKLACAISRTAIYEELSERTGYSAKQIQRILNDKEE